MFSSIWGRFIDAHVPWCSFEISPKISYAPHGQSHSILNYLMIVVHLLCYALFITCQQMKFYIFFFFFHFFSENFCFRFCACRKFFFLSESDDVNFSLHTIVQQVIIEKDNNPCSIREIRLCLMFLRELASGSCSL